VLDDFSKTADPIQIGPCPRVSEIEMSRRTEVSSKKKDACVGCWMDLGRRLHEDEVR